MKCPMLTGWLCNDRGDRTDEIWCEKDGVILDAMGQLLCMECAIMMAMDDEDYMPPGIAAVIRVLES